MERRRDYRHSVRYRLSVKCARSHRVIADTVTEDVSASGLSLRADLPHGLEVGDRCEVQLFARVLAHDKEDTLVMATDAVVTRADPTTAALRFMAPLAY